MAAESTRLKFGIDRAQHFSGNWGVPQYQDSINKKGLNLIKINDNGYYRIFLEIQGADAMRCRYI